MQSVFYLPISNQGACTSRPAGVVNSCAPWADLNHPMKSIEIQYWLVVEVDKTPLKNVSESQHILGVDIEKCGG